MKKTVIHTNHAPAAVGPYAQAILANGILATSGQLGLIPETGELAPGIQAQTAQSLRNLDAILLEAGFERSDVIKTTVFLKDMGDFPVVNEIYELFFRENKPARSCVQVAKLPKDGLVEIEILAVR